MKNRNVAQSKDRLDHLFSQVEKIPDIELQSHWARYLCVLVSGFIETSVRSILTEYARNSSSPFVANYVENRLRRFQNPKMQRILDLLRSFSHEWADQVQSATEGEPGDSIDSIIDNRNHIAHGENVGISFVPLRRYYQNAIAVIELIEDQCNP